MVVFNPRATQINYFLAVLPYAGCLTSLNPDVLIYQMGLMPSFRGFCEG